MRDPRSLRRLDCEVPDNCLERSESLHEQLGLNVLSPHNQTTEPFGCLQAMSCTQPLKVPRWRVTQMVGNTPSCPRACRQVTLRHWVQFPKNTNLHETSDTVSRLWYTVSLVEIRLMLMRSTSWFGCCLHPSCPYSY